MQIKLLGAILIIVSCSGFGFSMSMKYRRDEAALRAFAQMIRYMQWELQYHLSPLPELCRQAAKEVHGTLKVTMEFFVQELEQQVLPDAASCMHTAIQKNNRLGKKYRELFCQLGRSLGRFDLSAQVQELETVHKSCIEVLNSMCADRDIRLRNYPILGLCTGAALVILFI